MISKLQIYMEEGCWVAGLFLSIGDGYMSKFTFEI